MAHIWDRHLEQVRGAVTDDAPIIAAGLVCEGAGNPAFSQACWPCDPQIFMAVDLVTIDQMRHDGGVDAARAAPIDIFNAGCVTQSGKAQPGAYALSQ
jgi:hypothetical protein